MNPITIISTKSIDMLLNKNHEIIDKMPGGPLYFIENVFKRLKLPYTPFFGEVIDVSIMVTDDGEFGKIDLTHSPIKIPLHSLTDNLVISTILDEWDISTITAYKGNVFLDVQGYVRDGKQFGKKKIWKESSSIMHAITCMKATKEETQFLPPQVLADQKKRILLITNGGEDIEVWEANNQTIIPIKKRIKSVHTVGAGDTFFAYFVYKYIETNDVQKSVSYAVTQTGKFLQTFTSKD